MVLSKNSEVFDVLFSVRVLLNILYIFKYVCKYVY